MDDAPPLRAAAHRRAVAHDRRHGSPPRLARLRLRLSDDELADITAAAAAREMSPSGYAAEAAVTAARTQPAPGADAVRVAVADLIAAREALRWLDDGQGPANLTRAVAAVEAATGDLVRSLRPTSPRPPSPR